jgi:hypothetical protein
VNLVSLRRIGVHKYDSDLSSIGRVDQAGCVEAGDAVAKGETAPRQHQPGTSRGKLERKSSPDERSPAVRLENDVVSGEKIEAGIAFTSALRDR